MKIDKITKKAIDHFLSIDRNELQKTVIDKWQNQYGFFGSREEADTFIQHTKMMLKTIKDNDEINSRELKIIVVVALFRYAKKINDEKSKLHYTEIAKIGQLRDEQIDVEKRAISILADL